MLKPRLKPAVLVSVGGVTSPATAARQDGDTAVRTLCVLGQVKYLDGTFFLTPVQGQGKLLLPVAWQEGASSAVPPQAGTHMGCW